MKSEMIQNKLIAIVACGGELGDSESRMGKRFPIPFYNF